MAVRGYHKLPGINCARQWLHYTILDPHWKFYESTLRALICITFLGNAL